MIVVNSRLNSSEIHSNNIPIYLCCFKCKKWMNSWCVHISNICKTRSLLRRYVHFFVWESFNAITSLLWVKITSRKENTSVVYIVQYSYGEIKLSNHQEISFIKYSNECNKKKICNDYTLFIWYIKLSSTNIWILLKSTPMICQCISVGWNAQLDWFLPYT